MQHKSASITLQPQIPSFLSALFHHQYFYHSRPLIMNKQRKVYEISEYSLNGYKHQFCLRLFMGTHLLSALLQIASSFSSRLYSYFFSKSLQLWAMNSQSPNETILSADQILTLCSEMMGSNVLNLRQFQVLYASKLRPLLSENGVIPTALASPLTNLCLVLAAIKRKFTQLDTIYPQLQAQVNHINSLIDDRFSSPGQEFSETFIESSPEDGNFGRFIADEAYRANFPDHPPPVYGQDRSERKPMSKVISRQNFSLEWQPIFSQMRNSKRALRRVEQGQSGTRRWRWGQPLMNLKRTCCTEFMYEGRNLNVAGLTLSPLNVLCGVLQIQSHKVLVLKEICSMLNHGEGVCLFDCQEEYLQILPKGAFIHQQKKEGIISQLDSLLKQFYPVINFGEEIEVQFVPVVANSSDHTHIGPNQGQKVQPKYIPGTYVTRIKVRRKKPEQTYFVYHQKSLQLFIRHPNQTTIQLHGVQKARYFKRQFKKFYAPGYLSAEEKAYLFPPVSSVEQHCCPTPLMGIPCTKSFEPHKGKARIPEAYELQGEFNYLSLVCMERLSKQKLSDNLRTKFKRLLIVTPTSRNNGPVSQNPHNIHMLFSDKKLSYIRPLVEDYSVTEGLRIKPFMLMVEPILRIPKMLSLVEFMDLLEEVQSRNPLQILIQYHDPQQQRWYLETHYRISAFYIYLWLEQHRQTAFFEKVENFKLRKEGLVVINQSDDGEKSTINRYYK